MHTGNVPVKAIWSLQAEKKQAHVVQQYLWFIRVHHSCVCLPANYNPEQLCSKPQPVLVVSSEPFPIVHVNFDLVLAACELEPGINKLWGAHPALSIVGSARPLDWYSQKISVQLSVVVFVVENSNGVKALLKICETTSGLHVCDWDHRLLSRFCARECCCMLRGKQRTGDFAIIAVKLSYLDNNLAGRRHPTAPA